jgi:hypothetical protein
MLELVHRLQLSAERLGKAARMNGLIDAAHVAQQIGDTAREQDCMREAQKLYEELNDARSH